MTGRVVHRVSRPGHLTHWERVGGCPPPDDLDNDGLLDAQENLLSTLLDNPDSDGDGILDGNDDANGNGVADEDEDDEECPDRDSDGDGVADEDD